MTPAPRSDTPRQLLHISMAGFALLLRWLPWWGAAILAAAALLFNLTLLPRLGAGQLMREGEEQAMARSGVTLYALSVLALVLIFRNNLQVAAGAWGILAFGDGFSTLAGRGLGGPRLPWNPLKTWAGSVAFLVCGSVGSWGLMAWVNQRSDAIPFSAIPLFYLALAGSTLGAVVESLPLELNDNLSVPLLSGGLIYSLGLVHPGVWITEADNLRMNLGWALVVNLILALVAKLAGAVSWSGVWGGLAVGIPIATFGGLSGFTILAAFFVLGSVATRVGYRSKARRGIAQEKGGARGLVHAVANGGVAAYLSFLAASTQDPLRGWLMTAFVAALATAVCDTLGSEVGPFSRGQPLLVTRLKRVTVGTPGAVSLLGTMAGAGGALVLGILALALGIVPPMGVAVVTVAALVGTLLESVSGATLEPLGLIGSETNNFLNTLVGALMALGLLRLGILFA